MTERFFDKVRVHPDGCWEWTGATNGNGYGVLVTPRPHKRNVYAHRFSYEIHVGPIPHGLDLDHLCRNRRCVNPAHLEPVTRAANLSRGGHNNRDRQRCRHGHAFTPENTHVESGGGRRCRQCRRDRYRERVERRAA